MAKEEEEVKEDERAGPCYDVRDFVKCPYQPLLVFDLYK